ncbi:hypothetical protein LguiB_020453 [Lonicera macranthoides]
MTLDYYYLPAELLAEVLSRLPVTTLLRFTSVSKSWYSLITSPIFITTHQLNYRNNPTPLLLLRYYGKLYEHSFSKKKHCSLHYDNHTYEEFVELDLPHISKENQYIRIAGTCNGLVCLYDLNKDIVTLWNPSLKKSIILPKPGPVRKSCVFYCTGFGVDPISNDYKIARIAYIFLNRVIEPLMLLEVDLFELSTSSWRNINVGDYPYVIRTDNHPALFNGVVHWAGYNQKYKVGNDFHPLIVSFDMRNNTLGVVVAPPCAQNSRDWCTRLTLFGESLSSFHRDGDLFCCLWVMKEYGVGSSWMKQFTIDLGQGFVVRPLCCRKNADILLEKRSWDSVEWDLVSYDPKTKRIKNLEIKVPSCLYLDTYEYNESLVLTKGLNDLWKEENVFACQGTPILPREDDEVNKKN